MKNISRRNIGGFTLVEILVVVLIIGILSAVAVPMYQGAVDKTHFSTMLSPTRTLKEAQEAVRMATGNYTTDTADLDVDLSQEALSYQIKTTANGDEFNVILATNDKLPNVRLARYLDENLLLQGQLHCEAKIGDERANKLCGPLLIGQELKATGDGYMAYLLDEEIDQPTCDYAGKSFSTSKTKCYKDTATRCDALGMGVIAGQDQCGYENTWGQTIGEEGMCVGGVNGCKNSIVKDGGVCLAENQNGCYYSTIENGGTCDSTNAVAGCLLVTVKDGGECLGGAYRACAGAIIENGGTCIGVEGGTGGSCNGAVVNAGGKCIDYGNQSSCYGVTVTGGAVICEGTGGNCGHSASYDNGICVSNQAGGGGCWGGKFNNGSICYANTTKSACGLNASYDETSCCCGSYCGSKPKCAASRCDPQYMK